MSCNIIKPILYCWWTGSNIMSSVRSNCLANMKLITECNVLCLYKDDIQTYILPDHPLHDAYKYLSETHKGDYLKAYFMNFYGGCYSDIKAQKGSWLKSFYDLQISDKWIIGYKELCKDHIAGPPELKNNYKELIGNGAYICKANTPLTNEWYNEMIKLLDTKLDKLKEFPATFPQDCAEVSKGKYPIEWNEINGRIFHRISYKYKDKLLNTLPRPICRNYR